MPTLPPESSHDRPAWATPSFAVSLLIALAIPLYFVRLGAAPLLDPDEPYYAVPALEMLKAHSWAVPIFRGEPWFDKPILYYWVVLAGYKLLGVEEAAARIGSALAATAGAIAMATLAPRAWRTGGAHVLGALALATGIEYAFIARAAVTDMTLTCCLTLGFLFAARYLEDRRSWDAAAAGAAFGLAVLTKGPVGALVPALALGAYGVWMRRRELIAPHAVLSAAAGFLATAAPWYAYMAVAHRDLVVRVFLGEENLGRFLNPEHHQLPFFYVGVFLAGMLPWSAALPWALVGTAFDAWRRDEGRGTSPGPAYALFWGASIVALFSISASKLLTYVLPAFPPAAFLVARFWVDVLGPGSARRRRAALGAAALGAALSVLIAAALLVAARSPKYVVALPSLRVLAGVLVCGGVAGVIAVRARRIGWFALSQSALGLGLVIVGVLLVVPAIGTDDSTKALVSDLRARGLADRVAGAYRVTDVSLDFDLDRTVSRERDPAAWARPTAAAPEGLWIVAPRDAEAEAEEAGLRAERVIVAGRRSVVRLTPR